ncbi:MAG: cell wall-binding repeat-containing protein, partial [Peptococcaceae bacterium]|nr:cell wall-binding repeat-containing protein [Peptococcaceae bacterium]
MRKTKKPLAILAIVAMVLAMIPAQVFGAAVSVDRLYGASRFETANAIANAGWTSADIAIIAPGGDANLVDALAAAPLAGQLDAPILLTDINSLTASTQAELTTLGVTHAYVIGAIQASVVTQLENAGITTEVLKGSDRIATAAAISAEVVNPAGSIVVGYNALPDALSAASFAAANRYTILIANANGTLDASQVKAGSTTYVLGGPTLVADSAGATRIYGDNRFQTNAKFVEALKSQFQFDNVYVANGGDANLVDALVVAPLAAKFTKSPILLADVSTGTVPAAVTTNQLMDANSQAVALGGPLVVSDTLIAKVGAGVNPDVPPVVIGTAAVTAVNPTASKSVAIGQALVEIGTVTVTAGSEAASITGIKLTRSGLSPDLAISGITIWNGTQRLNVSTILAYGVADINFTSPVSLAAGQSATLSIKVNIATGGDAPPGAQFAFTVNEVKGAAGSLLPVTSGVFTVSSVTLGTLVAGVSADAPTTNLDAGVVNVSLAKFDLEAGQEDVLLQQFIFTQNGNIADSDVGNLKLYDQNGVQVGGEAIRNGRTVAFIFPDGLNIENGSILRLELRGDVLGGSGRKVQFGIQDETDVQAIGKTYGTTIVVSTFDNRIASHDGTELEINPGSFIVSRASSSPIAGTIGYNFKEQVFTTLSVEAVGEPIQLRSIDVVVAGTAVVADGQYLLKNLKLIANGSTIGQVAEPFTTGAAAPNSSTVRRVTLTNPITINPGTPVLINIAADASNLQAYAGLIYTLGLNEGTEVIRGMGSVSAKTIDFSDARQAYVYGNNQEVGDLAVEVNPVPRGNTNIYQGQVQAELASFALQHNVSEEISITTLQLQVVGNGTAAGTVFANFSVYDYAGNLLADKIASVPAIATGNAGYSYFPTFFSGGTALTFTLKAPLKIPADGDTMITFKADVLSTATATDTDLGVATNQFRFVLTGGVARTTALGSTIGFGAAPSETNYKVRNGENAAITIATSTAIDLPPDTTVGQGAANVQVGAYKLTNNGFENVLVKSIRINAQYADGLAGQHISNIRIVSGDTVLGHVQALVGATDLTLSTPLELGTSTATKTKDIVVLVDVSATAAMPGTFFVSVGDRAELQTAVTGKTTIQTTGFNAITSGSIHTAPTTIAVVAETIPASITTTGGLATEGNLIARFKFTNNGSKAVVINQIYLKDTMHPTSTLTVNIFKVSNGKLLNATAAHFGTISLGAIGGAADVLRLDAGASES